MSELEARCNKCKYSLQEDEGYSNYTVEGTTIYCLLNLNADFPVDRFYGEEPKLKFAEKCPSFTAGDGVYVDVEREDQADGEKLSAGYTDDPEIAALVDAWEAQD